MALLERGIARLERLHLGTVALPTCGVASYRARRAAWGVQFTTLISFVVAF